MVDMSLFRQKAPEVMRRLMVDFSIESYQAAGVLGNLGTECVGFHILREIGQPEGKGGYGWFQWTGSRRRSFLAWSREKDLDWHSDEANYGFLSHELQTTHSIALSALEKTRSVDDAVVCFERNYEQAGTPHYEDRKKWAHIAMNAYQAG